MKDKVILITGASSGVGKALSVLTSAKGANVIMLCRNSETGENAREEVVRLSGNKSIELITADLSSMEEIKKAASEFKKNHNRLDVLINNAATSNAKRQFTPEGVELTFATNHLSYFLFTYLLLDILKKSAPSRIINIASQAHHAIDFDNLNGEKKFDGFLAYGYSKMANIMFTYDLAEMLSNSGVAVNCVHPGVVKTNIYRNLSGFPKFVVKEIFWWFFITPEKSASDIYYLTEAKELESISGKYFIKRKQRKSKPQSYDKQAREKLWKLSESLTDIKY